MKLFWTDTDIALDETYVGGKVNRMNQKRKRKLDKDFPGQKFVAGGVAKTPVVTLINRTTGAANSCVVKDVNRDNIRVAIDSVADVPNVALHIHRSTVHKTVGNGARRQRWTIPRASSCYGKRCKWTLLTRWCVPSIEPLNCEKYDSARFVPVDPGTVSTSATTRTSCRTRCGWACLPGVEREADHV